MALLKPQKDYIVQVIKNCIQDKFKNYHPESINMPFHFRLLGRDRMALFSFIHSLNTTFGTSIFEPVAVALAKNHFKSAEKQYTFGNSISEGCQSVIQKIINDLSIGTQPDKKNELQKIRESASIGIINSFKTVKADLFLETNDGIVYLFDIKTAKPNISNFKDFKRTLLEWAGIMLTKNPKIKVHTLIAIPYNPYEPKPYERWTMKGMLDLKNELKVAEEFWDFLGGEGAYLDLLNCFEKAGLELRPEINQYFKKFKK
jgi:type II restriction enzyme